MWGQVLLAVVGLIGVLVTGKVLAGGQARVRHRLNEELELVDKMPSDLAGRPAFEEYLSESLQVYVDRQRQRRLTKEQLRVRRSAAVIAVVAGTLLVFAAAAGLSTVPDEPGYADVLTSGWFWLTVPGGLLQFAGAVLGNRTNNQLALREIQEKREQTARAALDSEAAVTPPPAP